MEFLAMLYTVLLVAICLMMALLLFRSGRPSGGEQDYEELKDWLEEQLAAQAREHHPRSGTGQPAAHSGAASAEPRAGQQPADGAAAPRHGREHDGTAG